MRRRRPTSIPDVFRSRMSRATPMEDLLLQLGELLRDRMAVAEVDVWSGTGPVLRSVVHLPHAATPPAPLVLDDPRVVASAEVRGNAWIEMWVPALLAGREEMALRIAPATSSGELHGALVVARQRDFSRDEEQSLRELGSLLGMALRNLRLDTALAETLADLREKADALQASRARVVAAYDEARRRIERDLHDGAQQSLVALGLKARAARDALAVGPDGNDRAGDLLRELEDDIDTVSADVRRLAHGVYPPELKADGLAEALLTLDRIGLDVSTSVPPTRFSPDIEATVYFCCLEAIQNVAKHAGRSAKARVSVEVGDALVFTVRDDGDGFDVSATSGGVGLANIADRIGALGGTLHVESSMGAGTAVTGTIPLGRAGEHHRDRPSPP